MPDADVGATKSPDVALACDLPVSRQVNANDYRAILSAVEQAIAVCDSYGDQIDELRARICEDLRRLRADLRQQLGLPLRDYP